LQGFVAGVLVVSSGLGCTTAGPGGSVVELELAWPVDNPRVRLERVVATTGDWSGRGLFKRLAGAADDSLFVRPYGVAWDGADLVVTDPGAGIVVRLASDGRVTRSPEGVLEGPIGVASCAGGLVVSDARAGRIALLDHRLRLVTWLARDLDRPTGIACLDDALLVVETAAHRVVVVDPGGGVRALAGGRGAGPGELNFPAALTVHDESLWIGDTLNFRLQRLDGRTGRFLATFGRLGSAGGETPRVKGIAVDARGHLWVSDAHTDMVSLYTEDGTFLMDLGAHGTRPGELSFPAGIAAHADGRVAVVDSLNRRLQIFRLVAAASAQGSESRGGEDALDI
jgi:sugar lactone lactonase YvrE